MKYCSDKQIDELVKKLAKEAGWQVSRTKGGHTQLKPPVGEIIVVACTPSDWRAKRNTLARIKRNMNAAQHEGRK